MWEKFRYLIDRLKKLADKYLGTYTIETHIWDNDNFQISAFKTTLVNANKDDYIEIGNGWHRLNKEIANTIDIFRSRTYINYHEDVDKFAMSTTYSGFKYTERKSEVLEEEE